MATAAGYEDVYFLSTDGLRLHAQVYGAENAGVPIVCLPGLTRNTRDFHEIALYLSQRAAKRRKVVSFDYRGRGKSEYDKDPLKYDLGVEAGDVLAGLAQLGITRAAFIGTSRGGLTLHVLAVVKPDMLAAVVLNDVGPVLDPAGLQHIKDYLGKARRPATIEDAIAAQKADHGAAFTALSDADWERMVRAIYREDTTSLVPDFDPMLLAGLMNTDLSKPLPDLWPQFEALKTVPVMTIRGANSLLLSAATLDEMSRRHPNFEAVTVVGQGHAPFLETRDLPQRLEAFFDRTA